MFEYSRPILGKYSDVHTSKEIKDNRAINLYSTTPFYCNQLVEHYLQRNTYLFRQVLKGIIFV